MPVLTDLTWSKYINQDEGCKIFLPSLIKTTGYIRPKPCHHIESDV